MAARKEGLAWFKDHKTLTAVISLIVIGGIIGISGSGAKTKTNNSTNTSPSSSAPIDLSQPNEQPAKPHAQVVADYKASAQPVTLANLQKDPNAYKDKVVTFTATITKFLQDSSGETGAMNVDDPNDFSSAYINLSFYIDLTKVNQNDVVQIWGSGLGTVTGQNAFGGTVNAAGVNESYLLDITTGYSDDTNPSP